MHSDNITPGPLANNEIVQLKNFLQRALEHFTQYHSSCQEHYIDHLAIIADCHSLVLLSTDYFNLQDIHFNLLHRYHFKQQPEHIPKLSFSLAHMINIISEKTGLVDHPWFYPHFATAVRYILSNKTNYLYGDMEMAKKLIQKILKHPH